MSTRAVGLVAGVLLSGCTAVLGVRDIYLEDGVAGGDGGVVEAGGEADTGTRAPIDAATPVDGGTTACSPDLMTDPLHCGECGHDCVGGACKAGVCEPVLLTGGLEQANGIAVAASGVYVTTYAGEVFRIDKDGKNKKTLATGQRDARGVVVDGTTVYWSSSDFKYVAGGTTKGGVWKCNIANCTPAIVIPGDFANNVAFRGGWLYFAETNNSSINRVRPDGTGLLGLASPNAPFAVAADDTHVYYTSLAASVERVPVAGGLDEVVGPNQSTTFTYVAVDTARAYWTVAGPGGVGHVYSVAKTGLGGTTLDYGAGSIYPLGITVDDRFVYWTNDGKSVGGVSAEDGDVRACPKQGCAPSGPIILAPKLVYAGPIAVDDKAVYWVELGNPNQASGRLRKVARPR